MYQHDDNQKNMQRNSVSSTVRGTDGAQFGALGISVLAHAVILLLLALIVSVTYFEFEPAPTTTTLAMPTEKIDEKDDDQPEPDVVVEVDVIVEDMPVNVLTEVEMVVETVETADAALSDTADTADALDVGHAGPFAALGPNGGNAGPIGGGDFFGPTGTQYHGDGIGFFDIQADAAANVFFIIDVSASLNGQQLHLIKDRLMATINSLGPHEQFEVAFFSGPTWLLFDDVDLIRAQWDNPSGAAHDFQLKTGVLSLEGRWRTPSPSLKRDILDYVTLRLPKSWGTDWSNPFRLAYAMEPRPEAIFFLTDGEVRNPEATLDQVGQFPHIPVMTIGFGLKQGGAGSAALQEMSSITGGEHVGLSEEEIQKIYDEEKPGMNRPYGAPSGGPTL